LAVIMAFVPRDLPSGTVTFLFTDVEGSTKLLHERGAAGYAKALAEHRHILRETFAANGGVEVDTQGDAFFVAFPTATGALRAAAAAQKGLAPGPIRVRMGLHTGTPHLTEEGYVGVDVHRAARIAACGHGGQVLVSASTAALLNPDRLRDLGEHRLKDLSAPERIFQFGDDPFPPLTSLHQTNLPIASTPFMGRQKELTEVLGLLSRNDVRLLTLTGPGGTGKTRLAAQAAAELSARYPHGVWWIPLASLRDPHLVLEAAARVLGAKGDLTQRVGDQAMLLLFDNFEQVIEAAADVAAVLASCPNLDLLVTSREPLHITGEQEYLVPPLIHNEAVGFFLARARSVKRDFEADDAVSEICLRVDDLPLALELAAARVKALSSAQILARLERRLPLLTGGARDLPDRQRTLRGAIAWSYELLTLDEQRLFARLAVFRGGCTLEAAEKVAEAALDVLQSLVDKSLLRDTDERYWMLETIREFASECLEQSGNAEALRRRHAEYFVALAEEAEPNLRGSPGKWLDELDHEHDNLRAALDRLEESREGELALRLAGALWRFWYMRGYLAEGQRSLDRALGAYERPIAARARALIGAGVIANNSGDIATARLRAEEALALNRKLGDVWGVAYSAHQLGIASAGAGDMAAAQRFFDEGVRVFRELGDEHYTMVSTRALAWTFEESGALARSKALHNDNLRRARALGDQRMEARSLASLGSIAADREGRVRDAIPMLSEAYRIDRDLGDRLEIAEVLCYLARALAVAGRAGTAAQVLARAEALREEVGATFGGWVAHINQRTLTEIPTRLDAGAFSVASEQGRALTVDEAVALALGAVD
jgi:predicted ATPase/class 3 adenylate cyclase